MGFQDVLGGAGSGAALGTTIFPGAGTVAGAIGGGLGGLLGLIFGKKNKPTQYTSGLAPQDQQFRAMLGQYLQQQMQRPWAAAQPSMTTPNMLNMLYGTYFRTPQGQPQTFNMPGLMYGGSQFGQPYTGQGGGGGGMPPTLPPWIKGPTG